MTSEELRSIRNAANDGLTYLRKVSGRRDIPLEENLVEAIVFAIKRYDELKSENRD